MSWSKMLYATMLLARFNDLVFSEDYPLAYDLLYTD